MFKKILNPFAIGDTPLCGGIFEHVYRYAYSTKKIFLRNVLVILKRMIVDRDHEQMIIFFNQFSPLLTLPCFIV